MPDITHDKMANLIANILLEKHRDIFGNVFIANIFHDFPRPDFIFLPLVPPRRRKIPSELLSLSIAFEFKTPYVSKHEYITGIGQAVVYNSIFPRSYLVIPEKNIENFEVLEFVINIVKHVRLSIGVIAYNPTDLHDVSIVKTADTVEVDREEIEEVVRSVRRSYAYWRETKPSEVFDALNIAYNFEQERKEYAINDVMDILWKDVLLDRFGHAERKSSFILNYRLFLVHTALLDRNGRLTPIGRHVLMLGNLFGKESKEFEEIITYVLLRYGGHYTLLSKIYIEQSRMLPDELNDWRRWCECIQRRLEEQNYYFSKEDFRFDFPRLPYAYENYFCGIASKDFVVGKGLNINFPKIIEILDKGRRFFSAVETLLE